MNLPRLTEIQERFVNACFQHNGDIRAAAASLGLSLRETLLLAADAGVRAVFDAVVEMLESTKRMRDLLHHERLTGSLMESFEAGQNDSVKVRIANTVLRLTDPKRIAALGHFGPPPTAAEPASPPVRVAAQPQTQAQPQNTPQPRPNAAANPPAVAASPQLTTTTSAAGRLLAATGAPQSRAA